MASKSDNVSRQYAQSFFDVANRNDVLSAVLQDIILLQDLVNSSAGFQSFMKNPLVSVSQQQALVDKIAKTAKLNPYTKNLLKLLCMNKRLPILPEVLVDFTDISNTAQNRTMGTVMSVKELSNTQKKDLEEALGRLLQKQVVLKTTQDSEILGGLRIQVGSYIFDGSLKHQLDVLASTLEKVSINDSKSK